MARAGGDENAYESVHKAFLCVESSTDSPRECSREFHSAQGSFDSAHGHVHEMVWSGFTSSVLHWSVLLHLVAPDRATSGNFYKLGLGESRKHTPPPQKHCFCLFGV